MATSFYMNNLGALQHFNYQQLEETVTFRETTPPPPPPLPPPPAELASELFAFHDNFDACLDSFFKPIPGLDDNNLVDDHYYTSDHTRSISDAFPYSTNDPISSSSSSSSLDQYHFGANNNNSFDIVPEFSENYSYYSSECMLLPLPYANPADQEAMHTNYTWGSSSSPPSSLIPNVCCNDSFAPVDVFMGPELSVEPLAPLPEFHIGCTDNTRAAAADESRSGGGAKKGRTLSAQSMAARVRRRKITEKTQELGKLVPGGLKMNTAEMFQAASKYIKFLQAQVGVLQLMGSLDQESDEELQALVTSPLVQEKLYSAEKCFVPKQLAETLENDEHKPKPDPFNSSN